MNKPLILAQASIPGLGAGSPPTRVIKLGKPQGDQALTVVIDGTTKIDFADIANEKITLVHVGDKLVILFEGGSTISIGPFFDASGKPLADITLELAPDRTVSSSEFAALFPITDDQSVLPAAGNATAGSSGGFYEPPVTIAPLSPSEAGPVTSGDPTPFTINNVLSAAPPSNGAAAVGGDTNVPQGPSAPDLVASSDSGVINDNVTNVTAPTFRVVLDPRVSVGDTVELLLGGASFAHPLSVTLTAADIATGSVFMTVAAGDLGADGTKVISAVFLDATGNTSTTPALAMVLDTVTPVGATPDLVAGSDSGASNTDNLTNATAAVFKVALGATVAVGDIIELKENGAALAHLATHTVTAADIAAGSALVSVTAGDLGADGAKTISAQLTDLAGNTSSTGSLSVTLDTTADVGHDLTLTMADSTINNAEKSSVGFSVSGVDSDVAGSDATVTFTDSSNNSVTVLASVGVVNLSTLADGPISAVLSVKDTAGNIATSAQSIVLDTTIDQAPVATLVVGGSQSGSIVVDGGHHNVSFVIAGLDAATTGTVTFSDGVNPAVTAVITANGTYTADLSSLVGGPITSSMALGDAAGNSASVTGNTLYVTLQSAINAAADGAVIQIAAGTYQEQVVVSGHNNLTIIGTGGVTFTGPAELASTAVSPVNGRDIDGIITVSGSNNITIQNITVDGQGNGNHFAAGQTNPTMIGIAYVNSTGGVIDTVTVTGIREPDSSFGAQRNTGIYVVNTDATPGSATPTDGEVSGHSLNTITIANSTVSDFQKSGIVVVNAEVNIHDNTVTGAGATALTAQNGIQVAGSTGSISGNTVSGIGYVPNTVDAVGILTFDNNGLSITGNTITAATNGGVPVSSEGIHVGDSVNGTITGNTIHDASYAIVGGSQEFSTTDLGGTFVIANNTITGVPAGGNGVDFETGPSVSVSPMDIEGTGYADILSGAGGGDTLKGFGGNDTILGFSGGDTVDGGADTDAIVLAATSVDLNAAGDSQILNVEVISAAGATAGVTIDLHNQSEGFTITGGTAGDIITGSAGADTINAGAGNDTVRYTTVSSDHTIAWNGTTATVTANAIAADTGASSDVITNAGTLQFSDHKVFLVGLNSDYTTIQSAINAAADGDVIMVAAGTYNEALDINKGVTIIGANAGVNGAAGVRGPETIITGQSQISSAAKVVVDGVEFLDNQAYTLSIGDNFTALKVVTNSSAGHVIENSVFMRDPLADPAGYSALPGAFVGSTSQPTHRALELSSITAGTTVTVENNLFTGTNTASPYAGDSWRTGVYSNGGAGTSLIQNNTFSYVRAGINADDFSSTVTINGNTFSHDGTAIAVGVGSSVNPVTTITNNIFSQVDGDFNFQNITTPVVFNAVTSGNATTSEPLEVLGSSAGDTITTGQGNDAVTGNGGADTISTGAGNDTIIGFSGADTVDGGTDTDTIVLTASSADLTAATDAQIVNVEAVSAATNSAGIVIDLHNQSEGFTITGGTGNDTITGGKGADTINAGSGIDTVRYTTSQADHTISWNGTTATVTANATAADTGASSDSISNAGTIAFSDHKVFLVGAGSDYTTIQSAINAAASGDTILIADGVYHENITVSTAGLTITAAGANAVIQGSFKTDNGIADGNVASYLQAAPGYNGAAGSGILIAANNVTLQGLKIDGFLNGMSFADSSTTDGTTITGMIVTDSVFGLAKGTTASVTNMTMTGGSFTDGYTGINFAKSTVVGEQAVGIADHIVINGTSFSNLDAKGIYVEALSNAHLTNIVMTNVGQYGAGALFGVQGSGGNGIDLNLKNGVYSNIEIDHFTLTNVGASDRNGADLIGHKNGGAIVVEVRDAGSYAAVPATLTGIVTIHDGTIAGHTSTGIQVGEPGQANLNGPAVTIDNVAIAGAEHNGGAAPHGDITNVTAATTIVTADGADNVIDASQSTGTVKIDAGAGNDTITAGAGNDTITGGLGSDIIHGGSGNDTARYDSASTGHVISWNGTTATITGSTDTGLTADTIDGVGTIAFTDHKVFLVGLNSDYTTIQSAINAAADGDVIMVAAGTYNEALDINKGVTIIGANAGVNGAAGVRGPETIITGQSQISSAAKVVVDGVEFLDNQAYTLSIGDNFTALKVVTNSSAGHVIENSVFMRDPLADPAGYSALPGAFVGSTSQPTHRALELSSITAGTTVTVENNLFTGTNTASPYAGDSWRTGVYSNGGAGTSLIQNNTFSYVRAGINADDFSSTVTINGNTFSHDGTAIAVGVGSSVNPVTTITNNIFSQVDGDFNFQNITTPVVFNAVTSGNATTSEPLEVLGSSAGDTITTGQGNDAVTGNGGADTISTGAGNDTIIGFSGADTVDGGTDTDTIVLTASSADLTAATDAQIVNVEAVSAATNSAGIVIDLHNQSEGFTITGGTGNDTITGGKGADTINAGSGIDTVRYTTSQADHTISWNGTTATVTANATAADTGASSDSISNAGTIAFSDHKVFLVGAGSDYTTIQSAINAAASGDTILIADGVYHENITVSTAGLTITAAGANAVIQGSFKTDNGIADGNVASYLQSAPGYNDAAGSGILIAANNVTLQGLKIDGFLNGMSFADNATTDGTTITGMIVTDSAFGLAKGTTASVTNMTMTGGSFTDGYTGINFAKSTVVGEQAVGIADHIVINGTSFSNLDAKGIYVEALSNAHLTNIVMTNVGQYGAGALFGVQGSGGNGIDLNLKNGVYSNIEIDHFTLTNVGASDRNGADLIGHKNGGAIVVEARDAGSYAAVPATLTGIVTIHDGTIAGHTSTGIQVGEPGQANLNGPAVTIDNVAIAGAEHNGGAAPHGDITNVTAATTIVTADGADNVIDASQSTGTVKIDAGAGNDTITAGAGNDTITGGLGSDIIHGGSGIDTARYDSASTGHVISWNGTTATITGSTDTGLTADTIDGVGTIAFTDHKVFLVGLNSDYTTIQSAINAAADGDVIMVAAGTYNEALDINKGVTIIGANAGVNGAAGVRGPETIITGQSQISSAAKVVVDGVEFLDNQAYTLSIGDNFTALKVVTNSSAGHVIENSVFMRDPLADPAGYSALPGAFVGSTSQPTHRALELSSITAGTTVTVENNLFTGTNTASPYAGDSWRTGVYSNGGAGTSLIQNNTFSYVRAGINADDFSSTVTINGNTFSHDGTAIAVGVGSSVNPVTTITGNTFSQVDGDFNFQNILTPVVFDAVASGNANTGEPLEVLGSSAGDTITTGQGNDAVTGNGGADTISTGAGNDTIIGFSGADTVDGGTDTDTIVLTASSADLTAATDAQIVNVEAVSAATNSAGIVIDLHNQSEGFTITGGTGNDTITGGKGADTINAGSGIDTVRYTTSQADHTISWNGTTATVTANATAADTGASSDSISNAGTIAFSDHKVFLVGAGSDYTTIQSAINAAASGDTILIADGVYHENITVSTAGLTITAAGANAVIQGSFKTDNGIADGNVASYLQSAPGYNDAAGSGILIAANNVTLQGLKIDGFLNGMSFADNATTDGTTITGMIVTDSAFGLAKGTTASVTNMTMTGGSFTDGYTGINFAKSTVVGEQAVGIADHIVINGTSFSNLDAKGIYVEALSNAHLTNIVMTNVGQYGAGALFGVQGSGGNGIDLNLKNGVYSNIEIDHFTLTNVGASDRNGADLIGHKNGGAIVVEARDAGSYAAVPATLTGIVTIHDGTIAGHTSTGIQVGEPGQANLNGPAVTIDNVAIAGAEHNGGAAPHGDITNVTAATTIVTADGADNVIDASQSTGTVKIDAGAGNDTITAGAGNDTITGGLGSDIIHGGSGIDTARYDSASTGHVISWNGTTATITGSTDTGLTADTIDGVGTIAFTDHKVFLVGLNSDYTTIQSAINAAADGDVIMVAAGTYNEALDINKGVTIIGANAGVNGAAGVRGPETIITGQSQISSAAKVVVDGVEFLDNQAYTLSIGDNFTALKVVTNSSAGHVIENSVFMRDPLADPAGYSALPGAFVGSTSQPTHRALELSSITAGTTVTVENNLFTGTNTASPYAGDSWRTGVYSNGGAGTSLIQNNTFSYVRAGINADDFSSTVTINGNTFSHDGTAIAVGVGSSVNPVTTITGNTFSQVDGDFNFQNILTPVVFDAVASGNANTGEPLEVLGSSAGDTITTGQGNDAVTGNGGADTISTGAGNDTIIGFSGADTVDGGTDTDTIVLTASSADLTAATDAQIVNVEAVSAATNSAGIVIDLHNQSEGFTITGGTGNDTITGGKGADTINAGSGIDTVRYTTSQADHTISWNGTTATVTANATAADTGASSDSISNAGTIAFSDHKVFLVGAGSDYTTIQSAINAAASGDTILIADGVYHENITVSTAGLTITAAGANAVIQGSFKTDNGIADGNVASYLQSAPGYNDAAGSGILIAANNVTLQGLKIDGFLNGMSFADNATTDGTTITGMIVTDSAFGLAKGTTASVTNMTMTGGSFTDGYTGINFAKSTVVGEQAVGIADHIVINGTSFSNLDAKGIYVEALSNAHLTNIVMTNVGQYGAGALFGVQGSGGNGIDLNLKNGVYSNIEIDHFTLTNVGASDRNGADLIGHKNGGAIVVEARDAGSYAAVPATLTGIVTIHDGTIAGHTSTGIQVGEPGQANLNGPAVTIDNVAIAGAEHNGGAAPHGDITNVTAATTIVTADGADNVIDASQSTGTVKIDAGAGNDTITAGAGNDTITGGLGSDIIHGGSGIDTARYDSASTGHVISWNGTTATITGSTDTGLTADTIDGVGTIAFTDHKVFLVGLNSDYTTIQSAINAAADGDVIMVAAGTYNEALDINKGVTIIGANAGVNGAAGVRGPETIITGQSQISSAAKVVVDGVEFLDNQAYTLSIGDNFTALKVVTNSSAGHVIENSVFMRDPLADPAGYSALPGAFVGSTSQPTHRALELSSITAGTTVTVENNLFTGTNTASPYAGDSWRTGVYSNGGAGTSLIQNNTFSYVRAGINADDFSSTVTINGNTFSHDGTAIAVGVGSSVNPVTTITGNTFSQVDGDFNFQNILTPVVFDAVASGNANTGEPLEVLGGTAGDTITTGQGNDAVTGNGGADTISTGAGNDTIIGFTGADTVDGGTDTDTIVLTASSADLTAATDAQIVNVEAVSAATNSAGIVIDLHNQSEGFTITGGTGNDTITGGKGADTINAGSGIDTVRYTTSQADHTISWNGTTATVTANATAADTGASSDSISNAGTIAFSDHKVFLVGAGSDYTTIQSAINAAASGDTILIADGVYHENITVSTAGLTITAAGANAVIQGSFKTDNGIADGNVASYLQAAPGYNGAAGSGILIAANNVTLQGLKIDGFLNGMSFADSSTTDGTTITGMIVTDSVFGLAKGTTASVTNMTMTGGSFTDGYTGINFAKSTVVGEQAVGIADHIVINGTSFSNLDAKGIYVEALSNAHLTNIVMTNVGQYGAGALFGVQGSGGNGIDLNLKNGVYSNIEIDHFTLTNVGASDRNGADLIGHKNGGAIVVEVRDAGSYAAVPATLTGIVTIHDGTIAGHTSTGIQVGEPGQANLNGPAVTIDNVAIAGAEHNGGAAPHGDITNVTAATTIVTADGADNVIDASQSTGTVKIDAGAGNDTITAGAGNDTITGGLGSDIIHGGSGNDTARYDSASTGHVISWNGTTATITGSTDTGLTADTIDGVGTIAFTDHKVFLVGLNSDYTTIQSAINAAADGDVIMVAAGTYNEALDINKGVTIIGANAGVNGAAGVRGPETIITGQSQISSAAKVVVDGVEFLDNQAYTLSIGDNFTALKVVTNSSAGHVIENSVFMRDPVADPAGYSALPGAFVGSTSQPTHRALELSSITAGTTVTVENNLFTGTNTASPYAGDSWRTGVYSNGGAGTSLIQNNTFSYVRAGINADDFSSTVTINGNTFSHDGTAIAVGVGSSVNPVTTITGNTFSQVDGDFNFQNILTPVVFDAVASGNANTGEPLEVLGGTAGDTITTGQGNDAVTGNGGADTISTGAGNDTIIGFTGADTVDGGTDTDTIVLTASSADLTAATDAQIVNVEAVSAATNSAGIVIDLHNQSEGFTITGGTGNDTITGGKGADTINAGSGIDTVRYTTSQADHTISWNGTTATVTANATAADTGASSDSISNAGTIAFSDHKVFLVGAGSDYTTIQSAINAAASGDTILIADGVYHENITVSTAGLTITAAGANAVIQGSFKTDNGIADGNVASYLQAAPGYNGAAGSGILIAANNVTLQGLKIDGFLNGMSFADSSTTDGTTITGMIVTDSVFGLAKGTTASVTNMTMTGGSFTDGYTGINFAKSTVVGEQAVGIADHIVINGTSFSNLDAKGIYVEALSNAHLTNIVMTNVGQYGAGALFGVQGSGGNGIDLNLKNGVYSNIEIDHFTLTNVGASDRNGADLIGHKNGGAIVVEVRDAGSYAAVPATLTGIVTIHDGTIAGHTSTGIQVGEPGQANLNGPAVTIDNVAIAGAEHNGGAAPHGDITNVTAATTIVTADGADNVIDASQSTGTVKIDAGAGNDTITAGAGNDTITGGLGSDIIHGGSGNDTARYDSASTGHVISWNGTTATITGSTDTGLTADTIDGVGTIAFTDHKVFLVGLNSDYTTIQSAINAAADGDVIMVAAGTYNEALDINKGVTIIGANAGVNGDDTAHRGAETVIHWTSGDAVSVTTTHQVTLDGLHFDGTHVITASMADANVAFAHSTFDITAAGNASNNFYFNDPQTFSFTNNHVEVTGYTGAFFQPVGDPANSAHSTVTITGNTFNGHAGAYVPGDDNVVPVIANLSDVNGTVTGNTFHNVDIGILVANGAGPLTITGNHFDDMHRVDGSSGGGYAAGVVFFQPAPFEGTINVSNNDFSNMDTGIRSSNTGGATVDGSPITIDHNSFSQVDYPGFQPIDGVLHMTDVTIDGIAGQSLYLSGSGSDTMGGTSGADHYIYSKPTAGIDHLTGFDAGQGDSIDFLIANFTGTTAGPLSAAQFGTSGNDDFGSADERFHYNTASNTLSYDSNGSASGGLTAVLAVLDNHATVQAANIHGV